MAPHETAVVAFEASNNPLATANQAPQLSDISPLGAGLKNLSPELVNRLTNRYFILQYELPEARDRLDRTVSEYAARYGERISAEYDGIFAQLSLNERAKSQLSNHIASIERARAEAESYLLQLGVAKEAYDKSVKEMLTPEQYQEYRADEAARPARRELKAITEFFAAQGVSSGLDAERESVLLEALKQSKRTPELDGPYGRGTHALVGREQVLGAMTEDMTRLRSVYATLFKVLPNTTDWAVPRENLSQYYGNQILTKQREIDFVSSDKPPVPPPQPEP